MSAWDAPPAEVEGDAADASRSTRPVGVLVAVLVVVAIVGFLVVVLATREPAANRIADSPLVGRPAPAVSGTTLDGDSFDLANESGRWTLVNFFATWCAPCRQEHDDLVAFDERHRALGDAGVVSIVFNDDPSDARAFFEDNGGTFPVIIGDDGDIALDYGVAKVPESYLVAPNGVIAAKIIGGVTEAGLEDLLVRFSEPE
jgi:cytochrome c biogenesis protein CcmG/thiol:disulfide interchange protein DsbE